MPWVARDVLDFCDGSRDLNNRQYEEEGAKKHRKANKRVQKKAKEEWARKFYICLIINNSKKAYQLVKDLTSEKVVDPQQYRTRLKNVLQKNKRPSEDGQSMVRAIQL